MRVFSNNNQKKGSKLKDRWDKTEIIIKIIGAILIPLLLFIYGNRINTTIQEKELSVKYIEIATGILSQEPKNTPVSLRNWAVEIIKHYSKDVSLTKNAVNELKNNPLPTTKFLTDESGNVITDADGNPIRLD